MRKANREIKTRDGILSVISGAVVCRIGMYAEGEVYIVPMNFGFDIEESGTLILYFHCANEGKKLDMIAKNPEVCFEMDTAREFVASDTEDACGSTMNYESIIGHGRIEVLTDHEERVKGLTCLMKHYSAGDSFLFDERELSRTIVLKLCVRSCTGKRLP